MNYKWMNLASFIVIGVALSFGILNLYWLTAPYNIADIVEPVKILNENNEIAVGEPIIMELHISKYVEAEVKNSVFITCTDGNLVTMNANTGLTLPVGEFVIIVDSYILPPKVADGAICQFNFQNIYEPNPLREIQRLWKSELFMVVPE